MKEFLRLFLGLFFLLVVSSVNSHAVTHYTRANTNSGIISNNITSISIDPSGSIWVGTGSGLSRFNGVKWKTYRKTNSTIQSNYINCIMPDNEGNIYVGSASGLARYDSPIWESPDIALPGNSVYSLLLDSNENIWAGTSKGLVKFKDDNVEETFTEADSSIAKQWIWQVSEDFFGDFWLATGGGGVDKFDDFTDGFTNFNTINKPGIPDDNILSISVEDGSPNPTDTIWIGTLYGVGRREDTVWTTLTTVDGLLDNDVKYVMVDYDSNKWFCTAGGLSELTSLGAWQSYTYAASTLAGTEAQTATIDNSGNIWVGSDGGVTKIGDLATIAFNRIMYLDLTATAHITVTDINANTDPLTADTITVNAYSSKDLTGINLTLTETDIDTGIFSTKSDMNKLKFTYSNSNEADLELQVKKGKKIFVAYTDTLTEIRRATAYYNEIVPFNDSIFLDPPCFIATAAYKESSLFSEIKRLLVDLLK